MGIRAAAKGLSLKIRTPEKLVEERRFSAALYLNEEVTRPLKGRSSTPRSFAVLATLQLLRHAGPTIHSRNRARMEIFKKLNDNGLTAL